MSFVMNIYGGRNLIGESANAPGTRVFHIGSLFADSAAFRPKEFLKRSAYPQDSDEEESTVGKMPPSESEDE